MNRYLKHPLIIQHETDIKDRAELIKLAKGRMKALLIQTQKRSIALLSEVNSTPYLP